MRGRRLDPDNILLVRYCNGHPVDYRVTRRPQHVATLARWQYVTVSREVYNHAKQVVNKARTEAD